MLKRFLFLTVAMLGMTVGVMAQQPKVQVIDKVVAVVGKNIIHVAVFKKNDIEEF